MSFLYSIFRRKSQPALITGRLLTPQDIGRIAAFPIIGKDSTYAEVSSAWLRAYYDDFRSVLFREGVTKWEQTFDCDDFASFYCSLAAVRFFNATWSSPLQAEALAIGEVWYRPDDRNSSTHVIVTALTERGQIYIEPQSGQELKLSESELRSRYLLKF